MKFHQINIGQAFIYQQQTYVKVSPVIARNEKSGEQCFMRRADSVQAVTEPVQTAQATRHNKSIEMTHVRVQFDDCIDACIQAIKTSVDDLSREQEGQIIKLIQRQGDVFRKALNHQKK